MLCSTPLVCYGLLDTSLIQWSRVAYFNAIFENPEGRKYISFCQQICRGIYSPFDKASVQIGMRKACHHCLNFRACAGIIGMTNGWAPPINEQVRWWVLDKNPKTHPRADLLIDNGMRPCPRLNLTIKVLDWSSRIAPPTVRRRAMRYSIVIAEFPPFLADQARGGE
ncbi:uncharacterized protein BDV17DRAFT_150192 [Aspergillus undulatus]|uniref:uncharacterized protein n=1 Tax=Aspergillus undulatus TaxID=1810928 RepID=UPI003CCD3822